MINQKKHTHTLNYNKYQSKKKKTIKHKVCKDEITLSENNRLIYAYKISEDSEVKEVTSVSLNIKVNDDWVTIVYYDSFHHGILNRHTKIAYNFDNDIIDGNQVKQKGTQKQLLSWAINDLKRNYKYYKTAYLKRNKKLLKGIEVNFY